MTSGLRDKIQVRVTTKLMIMKSVCGAEGFFLQIAQTVREILAGPGPNCWLLISVAFGRRVSVASMQG